MAGSLIGAVGGAASAFVSRHLQKKSHQFQAKMYKHRYQYQMRDMLKAGLNPILAYSQGPPGAPSGGGASAPDFAGAMASGARMGKEPLERRLLNAQIASAKEQANKTRMEAKGTELGLARERAYNAIWEDVAGGISSAKEKAVKGAGHFMRPLVPEPNYTPPNFPKDPHGYLFGRGKKK